MWWLLLPVTASVFYCFNGYIQNYLTDVALPKKRAGSLAVMHALSFFISLIALILIFGRAIFMVPLSDALGLMLAGAINIIGAVFYYTSPFAILSIDNSNNSPSAAAAIALHTERVVYEYADIV